MYILFEKVSSLSDDNICNYDCMGFVLEEKDALMWVAQNINFRVYKYCPKGVVA